MVILKCGALRNNHPRIKCGDTIVIGAGNTIVCVAKVIYKSRSSIRGSVGLGLTPFVLGQKNHRKNANHISRSPEHSIMSTKKEKKRMGSAEQTRGT